MNKQHLVLRQRSKHAPLQKSLPPVEQKSGLTQTEDILNSILPPREWTEDGQLWVQVSLRAQVAGEIYGLTLCAVRSTFLAPQRPVWTSSTCRRGWTSICSSARCDEQNYSLYFRQSVVTSAACRRLVRLASAPFVRSFMRSASVSRWSVFVFDFGLTLARARRRAHPPGHSQLC